MGKKMLSTIISEVQEESKNYPQVNQLAKEQGENEEFFKEVLSLIGKDKQDILDLNGGTGIICKALNERKNKKPFFFDINVNMQSFAKRSGLSTFLSRGSCLSQRYDYVVLLATHNVSWIKYDLDAFITLSYNALRVNGELIISNEFMNALGLINLKAIGFTEVTPKSTKNIIVLKRVR